MTQQLDTITACNEHDPLIGSFQYGGTASLYTGNLTARKTASGREPSGLVICIWKEFRGKGNSSLRIATFYRPVAPAQGGGSGSFYSQHLKFFNYISRRVCPIQGLLQDLKDEIGKWNREGYLIFLME